MDIASVILLLCFLALLANILIGPKAQQGQRNNMGACQSVQAEPAQQQRPVGGRSDAPLQRQQSSRIANNYRTLAEVEAGLRKAGLESSDLILAIDFTKSNMWQGERSFQNRSLHYLAPAAEPGRVQEMNPYQSVIATLSDVLVKRLDDDCQVPLYGFGDLHTQNRSVCLLNNEQPCASKEELLCAYADAAAAVTLSGPTSFAPIIREAVDVCKSRGKFHILVIVADGLMDDMQETIDAIVYASKFPLAIVMVGVGDGPWEQMETFDDEIPQRAFDNFQFVSFTDLSNKYRDPAQRAMQFALEALMELPEQYQIIKKSGLLKCSPDPSVRFSHRLTGKHRFRRSYVPPQPGVAADQIHMTEGAPGGINPPAYAPGAF